MSLPQPPPRNIKIHSTQKNPTNWQDCMDKRLNFHQLANLTFLDLTLRFAIGSDDKGR